MRFTDSHCHLDFTEFADTLPQLLTQCLNKNIYRIIVPAVNPAHWQRVLSLAQQYSNTQLSNVSNSSSATNSAATNSAAINSAAIKKAQVDIACCLGIHPWFLILEENLSPKNLELAFYQQQLTNIVSQHRENIVAIGECGIDVFKAKKNTQNEQALANNIRLQQDFFDMQLTLAKANNLPVVVHHCQSHHYILPQLKLHKLAKAGVIHAFSGSYQQAKAYVDLGFKLGIGGTITYPRAKKTINAIKRLPLSSLLLETDAPAMPLLEQQGQINSPLNVVKVFQALTAIRTESAEEVARQIELNVEQLFLC